MSNLRKLLATEVRVREIPVEWKGDTYMMKGLSDAGYLNISTMDENRKASRAKIWAALIKQQIGADVVIRFDDEQDDVSKILIVHHFIAPPVPPDGASQEETSALSWDPYDETDIALLWARDGILFAKMYMAAMQIVASIDPGAESPGIDPAIGIGLGNSEVALTDTSASSSDATPQPDAT